MYQAIESNWTSERKELMMTHFHMHEAWTKLCLPQLPRDSFATYCKLHQGPTPPPYLNMSSVDMDVDMEDAPPGQSKGEGDAASETEKDISRYPAHVDDAASSDDSTRPFAARYKPIDSSPQQAQRRLEQQQRFQRACDTITENWDHKLLRLLLRTVLPLQCGTGRGRRLMNFKGWQRKTTFDLAELAKLEPDVELAAE